MTKEKGGREKVKEREREGRNEWGSEKEDKKYLSNKNKNSQSGVLSMPRGLSKDLSAGPATK